jgi:SpoVK/Ycf46/Vps4 family AAA+-type ATPase
VDLFTYQLLEGVPLAPNFSMWALAESSEGKSGSDLKEICRSASMIPTRELLRQAGGDIIDLARIQARVRTRLLPVDLFGNPFYTGF